MTGMNEPWILKEKNKKAPFLAFVYACRIQAVSMCCESDRTYIQAAK